MEKLKKVLIVTYHFPPLNTMASKRYGIMCKYMEEFGYEPYIITTRARGGGFNSAKMDLDNPICDAQINRIGTLGYGYPIYHVGEMWLCRYVQAQNWSSRVIDAFGFGWFDKVKREVDLEQYKDIDLIIGTFPTIANILVAGYLSKKLKKPYIVEVRDLISDYGESTGNQKRCKGVDRFFERMLLRKASGIVTVTKGFHNILKKRYPCVTTAIIYNGWEGIPQVEQKAKKKYLYYAGSLYEHRLESLTVLLRAISKSDKKENIGFIIRSEGPQELDYKAKNIIRDMGLTEVVKVLPSEEECIIKKEQAMAYLNIVLSTIHKDDAALITTIPGKVFELLNSVAPVLAIVPKESEIGEILKTTNKGIATIDEEEILEFIHSGSRRYKGNDRILYYSRKRQAAKLCAFFDTVLYRSGRKSGRFLRKAIK